MDHFLQLRILEAMLFAAAEPVDEKHLRDRMPEGADVKALLEELQGLYANRGVHLLRIGKGWAFRTAEDLAPYLRVENVVTRRLSRAAIETLAIIAYHQPITRAEIEEMRGVALSRGTLDLLLEVGWIRPRGRRRTAGRPVTWGTSEAFLDQFGLESADALPGVDELKAAGLLERRPGFGPLSALREQPTADAEEEDEDTELSEDMEMLLEAELDGMDAAEADDADEIEEEAIAPDEERPDEPVGEAAADDAEADVEPGEETDQEADSEADERPTAELVQLPRRAGSHGGQ
jgi:segregation and condensation protein B